MDLKVVFSVPESVIKEIKERMKNDPGHFDDIIRDELDKLTYDSKFINEVSGQIIDLISYDVYKEFYMTCKENDPTPHGGRGIRIHHGRHKK